jgi:hypothetical protein
MTDAEYIDAMAESLHVSMLADYERLKAIAKRLENDEWKPIETAPKDGELILLYKGATIADRLGYTSCGQWIDDGNYFTTDFAPCILQDIANYQPSHWKPIKGPL